MILASGHLTNLYWGTASNRATIAAKLRNILLQKDTHLIEGEEDSVHSLFVAETSNADHRCWSTTRTWWSWTDNAFSLWPPASGNLHRGYHILEFLATTQCSGNPSSGAIGLRIHTETSWIDLLYCLIRKRSAFFPLQFWRLLLWKCNTNLVLERLDRFQFT
jgi:hypothetical protein